VLGLNAANGVDKLGPVQRLVTTTPDLSFGFAWDIIQCDRYAEGSQVMNETLTNTGQQASGTSSRSSPSAQSLSPDPILTAEFEYIAQSAFQANEDRAKVTNLYLIILGGLLAAILGAETGGWAVPEVHWAFVGLFAVLALFSFLTLLQLVRLRQAWFESARAMNQIKDFYVQRLGVARLDGAFRWRTSTLPPEFKPWSVSFLLALQVSLLGGAASAAGIVFIGQSYSQWWWIAAIVAGLLVFTLQVVVYRQLLKK